MPYGKFKGKYIGEIPFSYLLWLNSLEDVTVDGATLLSMFEGEYRQDRGSQEDIY